MSSFVFNTSSSIVSANGASTNLIQFCRSKNVSRLLLVTDKGLLSAGLLDDLTLALETNNVPYVFFSDVTADPTDSAVLKAVTVAQTEKADLIVGFGGGSPMDVAKIVSYLAHPQCEQSLEQCYGVDQLTGSRLPLVLVPTTAGTGSEVTPISIITTGETTKAGIVSHVLQSDMALLDASLTLSLPPHITAATGIDAMVHAIEAYTSIVKKNPISDMYAIKALELLSKNIRTAVHNGGDVTARENMLLGACLAGQAFANAPVAAIHALAYPLGGHYHIPHGLSNSLVLPHVMRFNLEACSSLYAEIAPSIIGKVSVGNDKTVACELVDWLVELIDDLGLPNRLRDCKVEEESLPQLAEDVMLQQRLLINNPRELTEADALEIYHAAY